MRKVLLLCSMLTALISAKGQDSTFWEIGLNATPFVRQYFGFGDSSDDIISPYMITAERKFNTWGLRAGLGLQSTANLQEADDDNTTPEINTTDLSLDFRAGWVMYRPISKKFSLKYGADLYFNYQTNKSVTTVIGLFGDKQETTISSLGWESGVSPFVFLQWHITPQFSLGTEVLARFGYGQSVDKEQNSAFPEFDDITRTRLLNARIAAPTSLFFILRF